MTSPAPTSTLRRDILFWSVVGLGMAAGSIGSVTNHGSGSAGEFGHATGKAIIWIVFGALGIRAALSASRREGALLTRGTSPPHAREHARSYARRRAIIHLSVCAVAAIACYIAGLTPLPAFLGAMLRALGSGAPMCILFGAVTAWVELVGRTPEGDGPHCANCGYPAPGGRGSVCPECGDHLLQPRQITRGRWHRPAWVQTAGVVLPLIFLAYMFFFVSHTNARLVTVLPSAVLIESVRHGQGPFAGAALAELRTRTLTPEQAEAFAEALKTSPLAPPPPPAPIAPAAQ